MPEAGGVPEVAADALPRAAGTIPSILDAARDFFTLRPDGSMDVEEVVAEDAIWGLKELADLPGFPLAPAARNALRKFTFDLDPERVSRERVHYAVSPETARAEEHLDALSDALLRRKKVTFTYHGIQRNQVTERTVHPYGLLFKHSHWYLVGWDEGRDAERIFRVDRMDEVQANSAAPATADYEMPIEPVLERYRNREAWELGEAHETVAALVRFRFPTSLWAARNGYGELVEEADGGSTLRRFGIRQPEPFLRWILSLGGEAVIESPTSLAEALEALAEQVAELYREDAND
jgi:proteasome accessory factor B